MTSVGVLTVKGTSISHKKINSWSCASLPYRALETLSRGICHPIYSYSVISTMYRLFLCLGMGDVDLVQLLLDRKDVDPNLVEVNHCSALMIACMHGFVEVSTVQWKKQ